MHSLKANAFCKQLTCPSSDSLLAFLNGEVSRTFNNQAISHLVSCDFCASEVEFYVHCPQPDDQDYTEAEIPSSIFDLATALLNNWHKDPSSLSRLIGEN